MAKKETSPSEDYLKGYSEGAYDAYEALRKELVRLTNSFGDVWATYYHGKITPERQKVSDQLSLVVDALTVLDDMMQEAIEDVTYENMKRQNEQTDTSGY